MVHYTVLVPVRDSTDAVRSLLPPLQQLLDSLVLPYEIICIDDASAAPDAEMLEALVSQYEHLRVLHFDQPRGTSAALTAGIAAARGDLIIAAGAGGQWDVCTIPHLIARLSQHDLVVAERELTLGEEFRGLFARLAHVVVADPQLHAGEDLLFAARREAVAGLALARGAFRVLPDLLAARGFRVCRLTIAPGLPARGSAVRPGTWGRMAVRWLDRSFEPHLASEVGPLTAATPRMTLPRVEARGRFVPQQAVAPSKTDHRESA